MGKQAPTPGNYTGAAQQQANASSTAVNQQTQANRPDVSGTLGSTHWTQGPDGRWTMSTGYAAGVSPIATSLEQQAAQNAGTPIDNGTSIRNKTTEAAYDQAASRLDPRFAQQDQLQASQLANMGLDPNSAAARASNLQYGQTKNDAYTSAMRSAIDSGNAAGNAAFANNIQANEAPLQQLLALAGGANGQPSFNAAGLAQSPQLLAALMGQDSANLGAWNATNQANADVAAGAGQILGGGLNLATKAFGF